MSNNPGTAQIPTLDPEFGHPQRWTVLWILCGSLVLVVVSVSSLNVAIPSIQKALGATGSELQWIIDSYALVFAGLLLPAGAMSDRYGRREALLAGLIVFCIASLGGLAADSPMQLILWRGVMGAGAALVMPATLSIIATVFSQSERPRAIAIWAGFAGAGGVVGLVSSGVLLKFFWRGSVFACGLCCVRVAGTRLGVPHDRNRPGTNSDRNRLLMPPATTALVTSLPSGKAGVGSAMNDVTREVGGALGIAVVGALLSTGYSSGLGNLGNVIDEHLEAAVHDSYGALLSVAAELSRSDADSLIAAGQTAFTNGLAVAMFTASGLLLLTAIVVSILYPDK